MATEDRHGGGDHRDLNLGAHARPRSKNSPRELPTLPREIILEILLKLPVKPLLRFKCVCKSWKSLISSSDFVKKHFHLAKNDLQFRRYRLLLSCTHPDFVTGTCSVYSLMNRESVVQSVMLSNPLKQRHRYPLVVGCCDGLVCIRVEPHSAVLWNPSTRASKEVTVRRAFDSLRSKTFFGFGYDSSSDDYKLVFYFDSDESFVEVFSMRANSWKRIQDCPFGAPSDFAGKFVRGVLNWFTYTGEHHIPYIIVSLDLATESYKEVIQPAYEDVGFEKMRLGVLDECLCVFCQYSDRFDVWAMREYGVEESWTRLATISYLIDPGFLMSSKFVKPLGVTEKGEILLQCYSRLALYNPKDNTIAYSEIEGLGEPFAAALLVETLISPNVED